MRFVRSAAVMALLVTSALSAPATATPTAQQNAAAKALVTLSQLNLTVLNNWQFNGGGEVEGKVWVGNNALGNGPTQIGFGSVGTQGNGQAASGQGSAISNFATVTVGGNSSIGFQLTNAVGGAYGATIVGNQTNIVTLSNVGGAINIGGTATQKLAFGNGAVVNVIGEVSQGLDLSDGNLINVGRVVNGAIQGGSNNVINVRGNANDVSIGSGTQVNITGNVNKIDGGGSGNVSIKVGGNVNGDLNVAANSTAQTGGNVGKLTVAAGSSATVTGSVNQDTSVGDGGSATIGGNINKGQVGNNGASLKVVGTSGEVSVGSGSSAQLGNNADKINLGTGSTASVRGNVQNGGNIGSNTLTVLGNASGIDIGSGGKLYAGGSINNGNNNGGTRYANYNFTGNPAAPTTPAAPTAPTGPAVPVIGGISVSNMTSNFAALSDVLKNLSTTGHLGTRTQTNGVGQNAQAWTFSTGSSTGYTVFNVDETIFNLNEFAYNFSNNTTPVIINVKNTGGCSQTLSCSYIMNSNFTSGTANNRNVIWNFTDASSVVLNRQFQGTVLAYLADLQANVIEGSVVARNFTQTNEVHLGTFNRNDANSFILTGVVPEPANWALMIGGFGIIGGVLRRRRSFAVAA